MEGPRPRPGRRSAPNVLNEPWQKAQASARPVWCVCAARVCACSHVCVRGGGVRVPCGARGAQCAVACRGREEGPQARPVLKR